MSQKRKKKLNKRLLRLLKQKKSESTKQEEKQDLFSTCSKRREERTKAIQPEVNKTPVEEKKAEPKKTTLSNQPKGTQDVVEL